MIAAGNGNRHNRRMDAETARTRRGPLLAAGLLLLAVSGCAWLEWPPPSDQTSSAPPVGPPPQPASAAATLHPVKPPSPRPVPPPTVQSESLPPPQAAASDGEHLVKKGETLFSIARLYDVDAYTLASANGMRPPYAVNEGQRLRVPRPQPQSATSAASVSPPAEQIEASTAAKPAPANDADLAKAVAAAPSGFAPQPPPAKSGGGFLWPVSGKVISGFGSKEQGLRNDGINIAAERGTPVRAADDGVVTYAGNELKGLGNMILIKHPGGWSTVYAHAEELLVAKGERVRRGQEIALVGSSGDVSRPQLHFQLRKGRDAVDPRRYLQQPAT